MTYKAATLEATRKKFPDTAQKWEATVKNAPSIQADLRIVGSWLWIDLGGRKAAPEVGKALEFLGWKWNEIRELYQHPCGSKRKWRRSSKRYEPRDRYGNSKIEEN